MPKIGLCLSGGAARGVAHLGVLQALQEIGVSISVISGVSSGAIAGAFYAAGFPPQEILRIICEMPVQRLVRPALHTGLLQTQPLHNIFTEHLGAITFADLKPKLIVSALDLVEGSIIYFTEGSVVNALKASSAVPILFKPLSVGNKQLVDGGILNNFPVECLTGECDKIIGVHVNPTPRKADIRGIRQVTERIFHLAILANVQHRIPLCDLFLEPPRLQDYHIYALNKAQELYAIGYEYTLALYKEIEELLTSEK